MWKMKIAIVHDWLVTFAGAERVLEQLLICYPEADLFSVVEFLDDTDHQKHFMNKKIVTTFIQKLPFARKHFRLYLPWMPIAIEQLDFSSYDLIISSSHAVAKGVVTGPYQLHISYTNALMRYIWDLQPLYLKEAKLERGIGSLIIRRMLYKLRIWDQRTPNGVDHFIANSSFNAKQIKKLYRRESMVIHPPVDTDFFVPDNKVDKKNFYLIVSRLVPYKRVDLIIETFNSMPDRELVVIGNGSELNKLVKIAKSNISFLGQKKSHDIRSYMQQAKAFVVASEEVFGISTVEAQACGTPVIAYARGGAFDIVKELTNVRPTGVLFHKQQVDALESAIRIFEENMNLIKPEFCRENALRFATENFRTKLKNYIEKCCHAHFKGNHLD